MEKGNERVGGSKADQRTISIGGGTPVSSHSKSGAIVPAISTQPFLPSTQYFIQRNNEWRGPFSAFELQDWASEGHLSPNVPVAEEGSNNWIPAGSLPWLFVRPDGSVSWQRSQLRHVDSRHVFTPIRIAFGGVALIGVFLLAVLLWMTGGNQSRDRQQTAGEATKDQMATQPASASSGSGVGVSPGPSGVLGSFAEMPPPVKEALHKGQDVWCLLNCETLSDLHPRTCILYAVVESPKLVSIIEKEQMVDVDSVLYLWQLWYADQPANVKIPDDPNLPHSADFLPKIADLWTGESVGQKISLTHKHTMDSNMARLVAHI